jgi:hypothetical protein
MKMQADCKESRQLSDNKAKERTFMSKLIVALCAMALVSGVAYAQETTATATAKGAYAKPSSMTAEDRAAMFKAAYEYAGVSAENMKKLQDLPAKRAEAKGDKEKLDAIRKERMTLITREQETSVSEYFRLHSPLASKGAKAADEKKVEKKSE